MEYGNLIYSVNNGVATVVLNRPKTLNALSRSLLEELSSALDEAESDNSVGAVLITGEGKGFSSGADLSTPSEMATDDQGRPDLGQTLEQRYNPIMLKMRSMPKPIIGAANGIAAGAGCSLVLLCDITLAARSASFLMAFVNIGLMPDAGATWILPRTAGNQRAMGFSLLGEKLPADEAKDWGLIWEVVDDDKLADVATALAERLAKGPSQAIKRIKSSIYAAADNDFRTQLDLERDMQRECGYTEDFAEGAAAFLEKRPAKFTGR